MTPMTLIPTHHDALKLIGVTLRTSHARAHIDIPAFWATTMKRGILQELAEATHAPIYAIYTDYESDWTGAYTMMLAVAQSTTPAESEGLRYLELPARSWHQSDELEDSPETVFKAWQYIWQTWPARHERLYEADIEVHHFTPEGGRVTLWLS